ncbi:MAG: hypothetical protein WAV41_01995 [Microgenomates group bacterium]
MKHNLKEIERKYLVKVMPDLTGVKVENQERYFLELGEIEKRITKISGKCIYEEKSGSELFAANKTIKEITKIEFERLKAKSIRSLVRKSYVLQRYPEISIKVYGGDYDGLIRAEFEFEYEEDSIKFVPPEWAGVEITETEVGRDGRLINLNRNEFLKILTKCTK